MWRSILVARRASFRRLTRGILLQPQVLHCKTPTSVQSVFDAHFSPKIHFHQTPLFFYQESSNSLSNDAGTSEIESKIYEESSEIYASSDTNNVIDKMPSSTSSDSEEEGVSPSSSSIFGETLEALIVDGPDSDEHGLNEGSEYDFEKLEKVLSLLQSSIVDGSLESSLDNVDVSLSKEFVSRVIETPLAPGEKLIEFLKGKTS